MGRGVIEVPMEDVVEYIDVLESRLQWDRNCVVREGGREGGREVLYNLDNIHICCYYMTLLDVFVSMWLDT